MKGGKVYWANENEIRELAYDKIVDERNGMIRVCNRVNGVEKWGLIHVSGREIIPLVYDYMSPLLADHFVSVFIGDYTWDFEESSAELFDKYLDNNSWNGDYYKGTLGKGKWGMVDLENKTVVPVEYDWVELMDDRTVLCNVGGSPIIKWYDGETKKDTLSIADGLWKIISLNNLSIETGLGSYSEVKEEFESAYIRHFVQPVTFEYRSHEWQKIDKFYTEQ